MMRLAAGQKAPDFTTQDVTGVPVALSGYHGRRLMLSFYRYAACPLCNLRISRLIGRWTDWSSRGLAMVGVFQSPAEQIGRTVGRQDIPFTVVADPAHILYTAYGVGGSVFGFLKGGLRLPSLAIATAKGFLPGKMEGDVTMVPADFLITADGTIDTAYYGKDIGDHLDTALIEQWLAR